MLSLLTSTVAMVIALAVLVSILATPLLALWVALSVRKSLNRIADALDNPQRDDGQPWTIVDINEPAKSVTVERCISNSFFGR